LRSAIESPIANWQLQIANTLLPSSNRQDARFSAGGRGFESLREYLFPFSV
jgi:hypothetical protein